MFEDNSSVRSFTSKQASALASEINKRFQSNVKDIEESKQGSSSPNDPYLYLNSMGGKHAMPVTEKRRASLRRKKTNNHDDKPKGRKSMDAGEEGANSKSLSRSRSKKS